MLKNMNKDNEDHIRYRHQASLLEKDESFGSGEDELFIDSVLLPKLSIPLAAVDETKDRVPSQQPLSLSGAIMRKEDISVYDNLLSGVLNSKDHFSSLNVHYKLQENASSITIQTFFPFLMAGLGMVSAGIFLDKVQHWRICKNVPEIFILVPPLLGLKGNLEMTLAARLSTYAHRGYMDSGNNYWKIIWANVITVEAQALVVAFIASLLALVLSFFSTSKFNFDHALVLCAGSLLTGAIASAVLAFVMVFVVLLSRKWKVNPDNIATPIAASLGDLVTLFLLTNLTQGLYQIVHNPQLSWIGPTVIVLFLTVAFICLYISYKNDISKDIILHCWVPVLSAMAISSAGGYILNTTVSIYKEFAMFAPIINGVGGNLVAIQASRISTYLHTSGSILGTMPKDQRACFSMPYKAFSSENIHAVGAKVMLCMVVPGQIIFLFVLIMFHPGHVSISPSFVFSYLFFSLLQVAALLQICNWLVLHLWISGKDPDLSAIPYLTGLGDFLGTALLSIAFWILHSSDSRSNTY